MKFWILPTQRVYFITQLFNCKTPVVWCAYGRSLGGYSAKWNASDGRTWWNWVFCSLVHTMSRVLCVCVCVCCWVKQSGFHFLTNSHSLNYYFISKSFFYFKGLLSVLYCIVCIEVCIIHNCILLTVGLRFNVNTLVRCRRIPRCDKAIIYSRMDEKRIQNVTWEPGSRRPLGRPRTEW